MRWLRGRELHFGIFCGLALTALLIGLPLIHEDPSRAPAGGPEDPPSARVHGDAPDPAPAASWASIPQAPRVEPSGETETTRSTEERVSELTSPGRGSVWGMVETLDGSPAGFRIEVQGVPGAFTVTDEDGQFTLEGLPVGEHVLMASRSADGAGGTAPVTVEEDVEAYVVIPVRSGPGVIWGEIVFEGQPVEGALIWAGSGGQHEYACTDSDGTFEMNHLAPGEYTLLAYHEDGRQSAESSVLVVSEQPVLVTLVLERMATISGRVVGDDGAPLPNLDVRAWEVEDPLDRLDEIRLMRPPHRSAVTEADGSFEVQYLVRGQDYFIDVGGDERHIGVERPGVRASTSGLEIVLPEGGVMLVRVVGDGSAAVPEAVVAVQAHFDPSTAMRIDGWVGAFGFAQEVEPGLYLFGPLEDGTYVVSARAAGYAYAVSDPVSVVARTRTEVTLAMGHGATVSGRILDPDGIPVEGTRVVVVDLRYPHALEMAMDGPERVSQTPGDLDWVQVGRTGADGRFSIPNVREGERLVVATSPAYLPGYVGASVPASEPGPEVEIRLARGGSLAGRVTRALGEPVTSGAVYARGAASCAVGSDGRFRIEGLRQGRYEIGYVDDEWASFIHAATAQVRPGEETAVEIVLGGTHVRGRVVRAGQPLAGFTVGLSGGDGYGGSARTDSDGRFEIVEGVAPGSYWASVSGIAWPVNAYYLVVVPDLPEVDIIMDIPMATVAGVVTDGRTGTGVRGAYVVVTGAGELLGRCSGTSLTAADGTFTVSDLPAGPYDVEVRAQGYAAGAVQSVATEGLTPMDARAAHIVLEHGESDHGTSVTVRGRVVDRAGAPVLGARVVVDPASGMRIEEGSTRTGPDGRFELPHVWADFCNLYIYGDGFAEERVLGLPARGGEDARITVRPGGSVLVRVLGPDGRSVEGALVRFFYPDGDFAYRVYDPEGIESRTDASGQFSQGALRPGVYTIHVAAMDGRTADVPAEVIEGRQSTVDVVLP